MWIIWAVSLGPILLAAVAALGIRLGMKRSLPRLDTRLAVVTAMTGGIPALVIAAVTIVLASDMVSISAEAADAAMRVRVILPLALGIIAVLALMIPGRMPRTRATADVTPRSAAGFVSRSEIVWMLVFVIVVVIVTLVAGAASHPDESGNWTRFHFSMGSTSMAATTIYGWYFSVPALIAVGMLVALTGLVWLLVPRPAWADDKIRDAAVRRLRCANIFRTTCGALLIHLGYILSSLAGTAALSGSIITTEAGVVSMQPTFAALGPALQWGGIFALTAGLTLWLITALTAAPARTTIQAPIGRTTRTFS